MPPLRSPNFSILPGLQNPPALHSRRRAANEAVPLTLRVFTKNCGRSALKDRNADVVGYVPMRHDLFERLAPVLDLGLDEEHPSSASSNEIGALPHIGHFVPDAMSGPAEERRQVIYEDVLGDSGHQVVSSNSSRRRAARIEEKTASTWRKIKPNPKPTT